MKKSLLQLIVGCTKQDRECQKLLFEEYYALLMKVAFRYVSTYEQALEATHNGFLRIFRECILFRNNQERQVKELFSVWIKRVFIITLVDHIKAEPDLHMPRPIPGDLWNQDGDRRLPGVEIHIKLIRVLKGLPVPYRLVFNLYVIDGFSHREIARMLDITVKDSKHKLIKARESCSRALMGERIP
jgi:RNA polymerase sigma factor (sigma-70 family)